MLAEPFVIARESMTSLPVIYCTLARDGIIGHAEAAGVDYRGETAHMMAAQIRNVMASGTVDRQSLLALLPPGGARNVLDCALWDWESQCTGRSVFEMAGCTASPLKTAVTLGIGTPDGMAHAARRQRPDQPLKLKLGASDGRDIERVEAVRAAQPHAALMVDVNEGWDIDTLIAAMEPLRQLGVVLIEQPLPRADDDHLDGLQRSVPLCADESFDTVADLDRCVRRYDAVNIKLDKCGGLTAALEIVEAAKTRNMDLMVGSMLGTSLGMAPAFVIGQFCRYVDLDGPLLLAQDRSPSLRFADLPMVQWPLTPCWGSGERR